METQTPAPEKTQVFTRAQGLIAEHLGKNVGEITPDATFQDLGADSLDNAELVMAFEDEFKITIPDDAAEKITTLGEAVKFIEGQNKN